MKMKTTFAVAALACVAAVVATRAAGGDAATAGAVSATSGVATASAKAGQERPKRKLTSEEARERKAKMMMRRYGGVVRKAGSAHGKVVFLNAQQRIGKAGLKGALDVFDESIHAIWEYREGAVEKAWNPAKEIRAADARLGVAIVDSDEVPALVTAPEAGWAVVNVRPLAEGCDEAAFARRVRVEVLRAFALIGGAAFMQMDPVVLQGNILAPKDLDRVWAESYGADVSYAIGKRLPELGVTPWQEATYKQACQQGWAPAPTNEAQKAIWDKVHEIPSEPIKIKYDPAAK